MKNGATIQLTKTLKPICFQAPRWEKTTCSVSYCTLHRIGYIMTSNPTAVQNKAETVSRDTQSKGCRGFRI
jgi:hypothetical protein